MTHGGHVGGGSFGGHHHGGSGLGHHHHHQGQQVPLAPPLNRLDRRKNGAMGGEAAGIGGRRGPVARAVQILFVCALLALVVAAVLGN